jgi:hypothetical protein
MKLTGPMMSIDASGSFGGVLVASKWKGRNYMRQLVKPSNPKSPGQVANRSMMKFLSQNWAALDDGTKAAWETMAEISKVSPFNAYTKFNMDRWSNWLNPTQTPVFTPTTTDFVTTNWTATAGVRQATLALNFTDDSGETLWGAEIHRSTTTGFTPDKSSCIAVVKLDSGVESPYVDSPLLPGTYFWKALPFSIFGDENDAGFTAQVTAVIT